MSQKRVYLNGVGDITIYKRRGNRNIRLSISGGGAIRVSVPLWTPYKLGAMFALNHRDWIAAQQAKARVEPIANGSTIGKNHSLQYIVDPKMGDSIRARLTTQGIAAKGGLPITDSRVQVRLAAAAERSLKHQAEEILPHRLASLATELGYDFNSVKIKKLTSRWGSCSNKGDILLSSFLVQLPWRLIDYVLVHELVHTKHKHHGASFWRAVEESMPDAKIRRKELRLQKTRFMPLKTSVDNLRELQ